MAEIVDFKIVSDNTEQVIKLTKEAARRALTVIGLKCERYAKNLCRVDTGLLRNSITYAISGEEAAVGEYRADNPKAGGVAAGAYSGTAPAAQNPNELAVYVGTNVEYAPFIEKGTSRNPNGYPFLRPAMQDHMEEYKYIIKNEMQDLT